MTTILLLAPPIFFDDAASLNRTSKRLTSEFIQRGWKQGGQRGEGVCIQIQGFAGIEKRTEAERDNPLLFAPRFLNFPAPLQPVQCIDGTPFLFVLKSYVFAFSSF